jgi:hypothetical protein
MIRTNDGVQYKRIPNTGDKIPTIGISPLVITYTAVGGETSINLSAQTPSISYKPGAHQLKVKRSSGGGELFAGVDYTETSTTTIGFAAGDALIAGEIVEVSLSYFATGVMAATPRPDCYTAVATTGQTTVAADFSWTYNAFPSKGIGATRVYLNGVLQYRGTDYTEVGLGTSMTNTIQFVDPLLGGENIILLPTNQVIDDAGASTQFNNSRIANLQSMMSAGTQGFVDQSTDMISVPNTTIVGRAKIPNLANDLRASLGVERIMTQSIMQLQNEFGPDGQPVFSVVNDDRGLIRFVGAWTVEISVQGQGALSADTTTNTRVEIVFYGTGLNLVLQSPISFGSPHSYSFDVDGAAYGTVSFPASANVITSRGYSSNRLHNVVSGLALGIHTVVLYSSSLGSRVGGFEILNANASGLININPGVGYLNGQKYVNSAADSVAYNAGVTGARGGRVIRYLNSDGTVGQAFTAVNAAPAYLTNADHTNEEVVRPYQPREFGCGRADDFSNVPTTSDRAFTLDDGTTTLVGKGVIDLSNLLYFASDGSYITLTFIGTGLDVVFNNTDAASTYGVYVDGSSIGTISATSGPLPACAKLKIASGLPYGTHTVKISRTVAYSDAIKFKQFIVYGPKKPTIPATALELCDYNVMATYGAGGSGDILPTGVLRKLGTREVVYVGTWAFGSGVTYDSGFNLYTTTASSYEEYTFFGTGIEVTSAIASGAINLSVAVDGSSSFTSTLVQPGTGLTLSAGTLSGTSSTSGTMKIQITNLTLGAHKVRVTYNSGVILRSDSYDIITPIHAVKSNLYADLQNTLPVGSCSLMDSRKTSMVKEILPAQKAWAQAIGVAVSPTTTSTTAVPCPDMSLTIKAKGALEISYSVTLHNTANAGNAILQIYVNGSPFPNYKAVTIPTLNVYAFLTDSIIVPVSDGVHKIDVYWYTSAGILAANGGNRNLTVKEI